jgi:hypothetical protein
MITHLFQLKVCPMTDKIISTNPANGWFFVHKRDEHDKYPVIFHRVVLWATYDSGYTIGLISIFTTLNETRNSLTSPPPLPGGYLHWDDMSEDDRKHAVLGHRPEFLEKA